MFYNFGSDAVYRHNRILRDGCFLDPHVTDINKHLLSQWVRVRDAANKDGHGARTCLYDRLPDAASPVELCRRWRNSPVD